MPLVQDHSLNLLAISPACYLCTTIAPSLPEYMTVIVSTVTHLQCLYGLFQCSILQVDVVHKDEPIAGYQLPVMMSHSTGNQRTNHDHGLCRVDQVLWAVITRELGRTIVTFFFS